MTPIIKVCTTAEHSLYTKANPKWNIYRIEVDGRGVGPCMTEKEARTVAQWLDASWESLP